MTFQVRALSPAPFAPLFSLSDADLAKRKARRMTVTSHPGTPCRVSLADAKIGETVLLLNYDHLPSNSPYAARHAIFVRQDAPEARPARGAVPDVLKTRLISMRVFDMADMMIDADVIKGAALPAALNSAFQNEAAAYIHLHYAKAGCFAASVTRG